jgi:hypothetical protein
VTVKLRNPKAPNVAQGVPIELRGFHFPVPFSYDTHDSLCVEDGMSACHGAGTR